MRIPILRLGNILLTSIQSDITDEHATTLQTNIAARMRQTHARGVILDITSLEIIDSYMARILNETARMALLMGGEVVITGMTAAAMATRIGFSRPAAYRLATAVSELGNNLLDHARTGGRVELMPISRDGVQGIEVVVEDDGPGIADREMAMTDGFSTDRGLGGGLGGCRRLVDEFALESSVGKGTRVTARLWLRKSPRITGPERQCGGTVPPVGADLAQGGGQPVPDADPGRPPCKAHHDGHGPVSSDPDRASPDAVGRLRRTAVARRSSR